MNELISHREQLHDEMGSASDEGIYGELPKPLLKLSQTIDNVMAEIGEEKGDVFFSRTDVKSRSGGSITLLTQGPKYHQYDVSTHLDIAGWAVSHPERSIYHFVQESHLERFKELVASNLDTKALELACVLHDIEKPFKPRRRVSMEHPWDVDTRLPGAIEILSPDNLLLVDSVEPTNVDEFRLQFARLVCEGLDSAVESKLDRFNGLLKGEYDLGKVLHYLKAYSEFDKLIIEANKKKVDDIRQIEDQLDQFIQDHSPEEVAVSTLIVLTDKFAQGVPPEEKRSENFEKQHQRATQICNYLIGKITQD